MERGLERILTLLKGQPNQFGITGGTSNANPLNRGNHATPFGLQNHAKGHPVVVPAFHYA